MSPSSGPTATELCSDPAVAATPQPSRRIKSIVVAPPLAISGKVGQWTEVVHRRGRGAPSDLMVTEQHHAGNRPDRPSGLAAGRPASSAFLSQFRGRCFWCLSSKHRRAECRDPIHCVLCRRAGHIARSCPQRHLLPGAPASARSRLGPPAPGQPLHARVRFPPPPVVSPMPPLKPAMLHHVDPARRPRESRSVAVPSPSVDQAIFFLRSHAVTLTAADGVNASSPMAVGRALEAQLAVPEHSLRVTAHHPEHYLGDLHPAGTPSERGASGLHPGRRSCFQRRLLARARPRLFRLAAAPCPGRHRGRPDAFLVS
ncbi:hypothetical protein D1007_17040 [Hordeum vulgare]|nr:hypothetical protein D1007_17040 [Hordeum vulgare]